jgi:hypothetical protein
VAHRPETAPEACRYLQAVNARKWLTARAIADEITARLEVGGVEGEEVGQYVRTTALRLQAGAIERRKMTLREERHGGGG